MFNQISKNSEKRVKEIEMMQNFLIMFGVTSEQIPSLN